MSISNGLMVRMSVGESDEAASCIRVIDEASFEEMSMSFLKISD